MKTPVLTAALPLLRCVNKAAWSAWLDSHHALSPGVWLVVAKVTSPEPTVTYPEAVEVALCHGWIDGQKKTHDQHAWLQKFTRRGKKSIWSKINREKVAALIERGEMKPTGLAEVDRAKQDGRWEAAYDPPSRSTVPEDFQAALDGSPAAKAFWATLKSANRYAILFRIQTGKRAETRVKRIAQFVAMLERGETLHP
jgi:uncharacterized protein YdeI (YjbR/CyaY-like superfamily)